MVSDSDLVTRLRDILKNSDLDTTTAGGIRRQLEKDFDADLSDRKVFIREEIDIFLNTLSQANGEGKEENGTRNEEQHETETENGNEAILEEAEEEEGEGEGEEEEDGEEQEEEEEGRSKKDEKEVKKRRGGFNKICSLSPQLQEFLGVAELARTEVVKKLWSYIRDNNLQDPKNKRNIRCDEALHALFRVNSINMFQMNKALSKHIWPLAAEAESVKLKVKYEDDNDSDLIKDNAVEEEEEHEKDEEEGEGDEGEEWEREKVVKKGSNGRNKKGGSTKVDGEVKKRGGGFTKPCSLSPELQEFIGLPELARTEVVKKLWTYIRENNLQDSKNRRNILCDESLRALFHVDSINMFQMNKALSKHIWPLNEGVAPVAPDNSPQKERGVKQGRDEDFDEPKQKEKRQKKGASGLLAPLPLSDALVKFFGTGESTLSRADAVKRMWEYIKQNDLQDPSDKRRIICDDKLKELFEVDSFHGFSVTKLLSAHFIKKEQ